MGRRAGGSGGVQGPSSFWSWAGPAGGGWPEPQVVVAAARGAETQGVASRGYMQVELWTR